MNILEWEVVWISGREVVYETGREVVYECIGLEEKLYMNVLDWKRSSIWMYWTGREVVYECIGLEEKLYMNYWMEEK